MEGLYGLLRLSPDLPLKVVKFIFNTGSNSPVIATSLFNRLAISAICGLRVATASPVPGGGDSGSWGTGAAANDP